MPEDFENFDFEANEKRYGIVLQFLREQIAKMDRALAEMKRDPAQALHIEERSAFRTRAFEAMGALELGDPAPAKQWFHEYGPASWATDAAFGRDEQDTQMLRAIHDILENPDRPI